MVRVNLFALSFLFSSAESTQYLRNADDTRIKHRKLSYEKIANYGPRSQVTDHVSCNYLIMLSVPVHLSNFIAILMTCIHFTKFVRMQSISTRKLSRNRLLFKLNRPLFVLELSMKMEVTRKAMPDSRLPLDRRLNQMVPYSVVLIPMGLKLPEKYLRVISPLVMSYGWNIQRLTSKTLM
jgi:hypothetical protein